VTILRKAEEQVGFLDSNYADHVIHSVYVYLLGVLWYSNSLVLQNEWLGYLRRSLGGDHSGSLEPTQWFHSLWAATARFHDLGYPPELWCRSIKSYFARMLGGPLREESSTRLTSAFERSATNVPLPMQTPVHVSCSWSNVLSLLPIQDAGEYRVEDSLRRMSEHLSRMGVLPCEASRGESLLRDHIAWTFAEGIPDHGAVGALMLMRQIPIASACAPSISLSLRTGIERVATSLLLHNAYQHLWMQWVPRAQPLKRPDHPLAYMLVLTDHVQTWDRSLWHAGSDAMEDAQADVQNVSFHGDVLIVRCSDSNASRRLRDSLSSVLSLGYVQVDPHPDSHSADRVKA